MDSDSYCFVVSLLFLRFSYFSDKSPQATVSSETGHVPNPNLFVKKHFVPLADFIIDKL